MTDFNNMFFKLTQIIDQYTHSLHPLPRFPHYINSLMIPTKDG